VLKLDENAALDCFWMQVLQDGLAWEEVKWSPTSVWVRGVEYPLSRAQFLSPHVEDSDD
jgi:hypothetical protein